MAKEDIGTRIESMLNDVLLENDLELYKIDYKKEGKNWILRVYLDKPIGSAQEYVNIDECELVTRYLSDKLDEEDFIDRSYNLEVSSPGLDRELIKDSDYERYAGRLVEVKTYEQINGVKNLEGILIGKNQDVIKIDLDGEEIEIPEKKISKINLAVVF